MIDLCSICQHRQVSREACKRFAQENGNQKPIFSTQQYGDPAPLTLCRQHKGYWRSPGNDLSDATRSDCPLFVEIQH